MKKKGAYVLCLRVEQPLLLMVGSLGTVSFPAGHYAYVGSAQRGVAARVARHRRLAEQKSGKIHWHIDYLLTNPFVNWDGEIMLEDAVECKLSRQIASMMGVTVPKPGFGASDCSARCAAHLYHLPEGVRCLELSQRLEYAHARRLRRCRGLTPPG
jgi:Uri superfamily endonuclease